MILERYKGHIRNVLHSVYGNTAESENIEDIMCETTFYTGSCQHLNRMKLVLKEPFDRIQPITLSVYLEESLMMLPTTESYVVTEMMLLLPVDTHCSNLPLSGKLENGGYEYQFNAMGKLVAYRDEDLTRKPMKILSTQ